MAKRSRVGSKAGVVVKRGAGGRIMGSVKTGGGRERIGYSIQSPGHTQTISISGRKVSASSYFPGTPGRQAQYVSYPSVDRAMAAAAIRDARKSGKTITKMRRPGPNL
jgi:hypothetical protein